jgi:hypothetical protein
LTGTLPIAKLAVHSIASLGVSKVIWDVVAKNTIVNSNFDAVRVLAGSLVLASMVTDHAAKHVNDRFDEVSAWYENRKVENPSK